MTYTSPTTMNASRGIISLLEYVNEVTEFWLIRMILIGIFVIFTMGYLKSKSDEDFVGAIAVGSYVTLIIGLLFWLAGFLDVMSFSLIIGVSLISSAILFMDRRGN